MSPFSDLSRVIDQVGKDRGIDKAILIDALENAILTAARKKFGPRLSIEVLFNDEEGEIEVFQFKEVVESVRNPEVDISLEEARATLDPEAEIGDSLGIKMDLNELGRIAAQVAKQVIIQRVKDAERENIYGEYKDRKGELVHGIVHRFEGGNVIVNLGRAEAVLPPHEQVPREAYRQGDRIRAYILDVRRNPREAQIILSRTHPNLVVKLFEVEVPEVYEGIVKVVSAAREPGLRSKIAVASTDSDVDPVGACVGMKGSRVQSVVQELRGERIDIIPYTQDPARFVCNALAPAEVNQVFVDEDNLSMEVIVPDDHLSLAIGKKGQNVRLAAKLTGWKIDVRSEEKLQQIMQKTLCSMCDLQGVGEATANLLYNHGYQSIESLAEAEMEELTQISGIGEKKAVVIIRSAREALSGAAPQHAKPEDALTEDSVTEQEVSETADSLVMPPTDKGETAKGEQVPGEEETDDEVSSREYHSLDQVETIPRELVLALKNAGYQTVGSLLDATRKALKAVPGMENESTLDRVIQMVYEHITAAESSNQD
ncbi:MAG: transcription termination/antitermination protein NusA [Deltaproteobacteria bacterium]|nr:transcription termination/antitermination protein NusA [Deltaproteobacteria bacterium]